MEPGVPTVWNNGTRTFEIPNTIQTRKMATITNTAGTLWTPAAGFKIRLQMLSFSLSPLSTTAAGFWADFATSVSGLVVHRKFISNGALAAPGVPIYNTIVFPPNGILLTTNEALTYAISTAFTAGALQVEAWGSEE